MITAQDKILHVANKLGLTSLKDMQASTGAVYDVDTELSGLLFTNSARHQNPGITNITENQFEVNEALLIETISFYASSNTHRPLNLQQQLGSNAIIVFDLVIGNKRVMKDTPIFASGSPYTFASVGQRLQGTTSGVILQYFPRHQVYMEGAGILIPPQVQYYVDYRVYDIVTGDVLTLPENRSLGCYLFGTKVLLNFNTSI